LKENSWEKAGIESWLKGIFLKVKFNLLKNNLKINKEEIENSIMICEKLGFKENQSYLKLLKL
jgi:hypothetical protein